MGTLTYERADLCPLVHEWAEDLPACEWERYRVTQIQRAPQEAAKIDLIYNEYLTISGVPTTVEDYSIAGGWVLEWLLNIYHPNVDALTAIPMSPTDICEHTRDWPGYLVELIARLTTVSLRSQALIAELPPLAPF